MLTAALPDARLLELVMRESGQGWECRCGAWAGGWWGDEGPRNSELICDECLFELLDELLPPDEWEARGSDDGEADPWIDEICERVDGLPPVNGERRGDRAD